MKKQLLAIAACSLIFSPLVQADNHPHWGYKGHGGASHWAELDESFAACKLGKQQSPINIETAKTKKAELAPLAFAYTASAAEVVNNGHTIQINLPAAGSVGIAGADYKLLQFHFHAPSEEFINGKPYPMVAHLVHKNAEGKLAVVAVLFKRGKENAALKAVFANLPAKEGETKALEAPLNVADFLPKDQAYYAFAGSLTTPPCSEEVRWQVLKTPVELSAAQIATFRKLYPMNARPVQPLNGRTVEVSQ